MVEDNMITWMAPEPKENKFKFFFRVYIPWLPYRLTRTSLLK